MADPTMEDVEKLIDAADSLINALRTSKPAIDANPMMWTRIEARIQASMDAYDAAREKLVGPIDKNEPEERHKPL